MLADQFRIRDSDVNNDRSGRQMPRLGYAAFEVGLNNQKMALLGLLDRARQAGAAVVLPQLALFNPGLGVHGQAPLDSLFPVEPLYRFASAYGITIHDSAPVDSISSFDCFTHGSKLIAAAGLKGLVALDEFTGQFFRVLRPHLHASPLLHRLKQVVFHEKQVSLVVQLRIEKDWAAYTERTLNAILSPQEDYKPGFHEIFDKIAASLPDQKNIYVVCDESDLPVGKDEIRHAVKERFGITLTWKSDILSEGDLNTLSLLEQSVIDFEMAVAARGFVGMSRSTFANMACFESFCRQGAVPRHHFIYNLPGARLGRRADSGAALAPNAACDLLLARRPLAPPHHADITLPMKLLAHISSFGDFTTLSGKIGGAFSGSLCCGVRGDGGRRLIEGLSVSSQVPDLGLAYRVMSQSGTWTDWQHDGAYAGTRGLGQQVYGLSLRLTGSMSLNYTCQLIASFAGKPDLVQVSNGQDCVAEPPRPLEAMQIVFRRV